MCFLLILLSCPKGLSPLVQLAVLKRKTCRNFEYHSDESTISHTVDIQCNRNIFSTVNTVRHCIQNSKWKDKGFWTELQWAFRNLIVVSSSM